MAPRFVKTLLVDDRRQALHAEFPLEDGTEVEAGVLRLAVEGLVPRLRLQQGPPVPFGAVGLAFNGTEVPPHQPALLRPRRAVRAGLLLGRERVRVLGDAQSLEPDLDVFGGAALFQGLMVVLVLVAQNIALFDETVGEVWEACVVGVLQGVLPTPGRGAAAALGAAAQAAVVRVQRAALAGLTRPLAAGGALEDLQGPGGGCKEKNMGPVTEKRATVRAVCAVSCRIRYLSLRFYHLTSVTRCLGTSAKNTTCRY